MSFQGGRVGGISAELSYDNYKLFQENKNLKNFNEEAIKGVHVNNPLANIFFSQANIDALQESIRYLVYQKSCQRFIISRQSDTELKLIMRAYYLQEGVHRQYDILDEVKSLNNLVLNYAVPKIIQEVQMFNKYKEDVNKNPTPMLARGEHSSSKGTRQLILKEL